MIKYISNKEIFDLVKKDYRFWADEDCIMRGTEFLEIIFYSKYATVNNCWCFWIEKGSHEQSYDFLKCKNVGGFGYSFPLEKILLKKI